MPRLSKEERERAMGMLECGISATRVAQRFGCSRRMVYNLQERHQATGTTTDRPRSGRPRVTSARQDRAIVREHVRNPFRTAAQTARETPGRNNPRISRFTVRRRLSARQIRAYRPYVGPVLTEQRMRNRAQWAANHGQAQWGLQNWRRVVFSDESRYRLFQADGRQRVYRRRNQRFQRNNVREVDRFGGGSIMVWGAIKFGWRSQLVVIEDNLTSQRYIDEVVTPHVLPYFRNNPNSVFMHDNARPHAARRTTDHLQINNIVTLPWPAYSPDMNPIEHLWDHLDRRVRSRQPGPQNLRQLRQMLIDEWNNFPQYRINRLITSMPRRVAALSRARGGHTRY